MKIKTGLAAAVTACALLILPVAASAASLPSLFSTAVKVRAYGFTVSGYAGNAGSASASASFIRTKGGSQQSHYVATQKNVTYTAKADLSKATLKGSFGKYGKVSMKFRATGRTKHILPRGCKGKAPATRAGVLTGTVKVRIDSNYFRTVTKHSLPATLTSQGSLRCAGAPGGIGVFQQPKLQLSASKYGNPFYSLGFQKSPKGVVTGSASYTSTNRKTGVTLSRTIYATGKARSFTATKGLATARVAGVSPFFGGTLRFKAAQNGESTSTPGTLSGSFVVKFDSGGRKGLPKGATVNLSGKP